MLGELIGECTGRIAGVRVIASDDQQTRLEVSLQGEGRVMGQLITDFGTLQQEVRSDGILRGRAHHVMMTANGEAGDWTGAGVGRPAGAGFKSAWGAYGLFESAGGVLESLETIVTAIEFDVEEDGAYRWRMWEWTGAPTTVAALNR
jgi:hypothetical protein